MTAAAASVRLENHQAHRVGIGESRPAVSWTWAPGVSDASTAQKRAQVQVTRSSPGTAEHTAIYDLDGPDQVMVPWPAPPLRSRERVVVSVRMDDGAGWGPWSDPSVAEAGLLEPADWVAQAVGPVHEQKIGEERRPSRVRHVFTLPARPQTARLYLSGHGLVEAEINGVRVGDEELTPGWTSYRHRLRYATFDVTDLVRAGENAIGVWLADGWWRGRLGFAGGRRDIWGADIAAIAQLEVLDATGTVHTIASDEQWRVGPGPILEASLYDGETFDARLHDPAWSTARFDDAGWTAVMAHPVDAARFVAPTGPPVRVVEELSPVEVRRLPGERWLVDFGQNHSGRLRVAAPAGHAGGEIVLRHAEVVDADGELVTEPLRTAKATDRLLLADGAISWRPRFTLHGYRYAEVSGWPGDLRPTDIVSEVLHSDMTRRGWFECSQPLVNRLHENVVWGLRSNFVDVPTDCPQRDERLGWTGDIQVFAPAAAFLYDVSGMLASWLADLAAEQAERDWVPLWVPYFDLDAVSEWPPGPSAVWGDAALLVPDALHERYGDRGVLRRQYASGVAWVEAVRAGAGADLICRDTTQLGDWLDPAAPPADPAAGRTDRYLVATAYFAHAARRLTVIARALGETADAEHYARLGDDVARAYATHYIGEDGRLTSDAQTAYALTTTFDLWPDEAAKARGTDRLAELVRESDWTIGTGFAGTPVLPDALTLGGRLDDAYRMLETTDCPSWLYAVTMGATTVWERWDSLRTDGTVNDPWMTSFNHYAFGAVADWLHRVVAGIAPAAPGYRRIRFAPQPGGTLTWARAEHDTPYGRAAISWRLDGTTLTGEVTVPPGVTAELHLPGLPERELGPGTASFLAEVSPVTTEGDDDAHR